MVLVCSFEELDVRDERRRFDPNPASSGMMESIPGYEGLKSTTPGFTSAINRYPSHLHPRHDNIYSLLS